MYNDSMNASYYTRSVNEPYLDYDFIDAPVSKNEISFLSAAAKIAATSPNRFRMGAMVVKSGRVLGGAVNLTKKSPSTPPNRFSTHAEISAMRLASDTTGSTLYIARLDKYENTVLAKPCAWCIQKILQANVYRVVFTTNEAPMSFYTDMVTWVDNV
jgi:tRNA(Arg) A34 adenosine deaminase TadA